MTARTGIDAPPTVTPLESQPCYESPAPTPLQAETDLSIATNVPIDMRPNTAASCLGDLSINFGTAEPTPERAATVPSGSSAQNEVRTDSFYKQAAGASQQEIQDMLQSGRISEHERELIEKISDQGGRMYIEDRLRAFILGANSNPADFQKELRTLSAVQMRDVAVDYNLKYGGAVHLDFENRIDKSSRRQYAGMFDYDHDAARKQQEARFWRLPSERF